MYLYRDYFTANVFSSMSTWTLRVLLPSEEPGACPKKPSTACLADIAVGVPSMCQPVFRFRALGTIGFRV